MTTNSLFNRKKDCCGCEACAIICPVQIIKMTSDEEGFRYPKITKPDLCLNCKRCLNICPIKSCYKRPSKCFSSYGGYCHDIEEIKRSSSGSIATSIGKLFINRGGVVYGVRYSSDFKAAEYARANNLECLEQFRTSKYIQANKNDIFLKVREDLRSGISVLFVGLPCEIAALNNYIGREQELLTTAALICHGPTSQKVQQSFCAELESMYKANILHFSVRYKLSGWKPYYIKTEFDNGEVYLEKFVNTKYETAFQYMKRPSCSSCKFKLYNKDKGIQSDIIIGDFHLAHLGMPQYNEWGSSQITVCSDKGNSLIEELRKVCELYPITEREAVHYNSALFKPIHSYFNRVQFGRTFANKSLTEACSLPSVYVINLYKKIKNRILIIASHIARPIRKIL